MSAQLHHFQFDAMGGPCSVHLWLPESANLQVTQNLLMNEVERLEHKYSRFRPMSLLSQINRQELNNQPLDQETQGLLNYVEQCFELSGHMFDPTVGSLREVWDFKIPVLPDPVALTNAIEKIGWQKVNWDGYCVNLTDNVQIDLGGVVKEFAVDRLTNMLKEQGIAGLVNLSGDIAVSFPPPDATAWQVAVQNPRGEGAIATLELIGGAIAGSGDYERFIEVGGQRYCHILRPDTGYPSMNGYCSVSVIAENCLLAGTVSTVAMLKGAQAQDWLDEMNLPYLAFDSSLNAFGTIEV